MERVPGRLGTDPTSNVTSSESDSSPARSRCSCEDAAPPTAPPGYTGSGPDAAVPLKDLTPGHRLSLDAISLRAFLLGATTGQCVLVAAYLSIRDSRLWRAPFFFGTLTLFHFLEFYAQARWNTPNASVSSFLLFNNGLAYQAAHGTALLEAIVTSLLFPAWQSRFSHVWIQVPGLMLIILGQFARSAAMATAGANFNHKVQRTRRQGHVLVTDGIYRWLRHPSYFGFFWWALGTQIVVGNFFSFCIYFAVLWRFFNGRIKGEPPRSSLPRDGYIVFRHRPAVAARRARSLIATFTQRGLDVQKQLN